MKTVCLLPPPPPGALGGVARHVQGLRRHLPAFGWQVVEEPEEADIVHVHAAEQAPSVDVYTNHGIHPLRPNMPTWQRNQNAAIFDNLKWARQVIAVSQWTANQWTGLTGIQPHIIPNGIDPNEWKPDGLRYRARTRYDLGVKPETPVVLWGKVQISDVCDPTPALELALRRPDVVVAMTVDAKLLPHAPTNVRLLGQLPFEQMQGMLAECDVYLATTLENHSVQVLEAMVCGKPVLGYAWGGTAETVQDGVHGRLVAPGDDEALEKALDDVLAHREAYGKASRERARSVYDLAKLAKRVAAVYDLALAEKAQERAPETPVCSIVIPLYNKQDYVRETIGSAMRQRFGSYYEVIVVNDGSTDASLGVAQRAVAEFGRPDVVTKVIDLPNGGVAAARNAGIKASRGRYICCLDADDRIDPQFLARLSAALDSDPGLGIAYSDMTTFGYTHERGNWQATVVCSEYDFEALKRGNMIPCCNLFRRKAWERAGGYRDINPSWEDYELWLRMGKLGWHGQRVPGGLFHYRKVPNQGRDHESQGQVWRLRATVNRMHRDLYPPTVSVVIPCYQQSAFLPEAIDSVMAQTFPDLECVVVDDGNDAQEAAAIRAIVKLYRNDDVRLVVNDTNRKLAGARNAGIEAARGSWIVPLDADDKLAPAFVERALRSIEFDPKRFAYTDSYLWWPDEGRVQLLEAAEYDFADLLRRVTWPCTILYAKDAWRGVRGYKQQMSEAGGWEDWEFALSLGEVGVCGQRVAEPLFYYRQHSSNQMRHAALKEKPRLQEMLRRLHAAVYRGERPMGCCGGRRQPQAPGAPAQQSIEALAASAGSSGKVLVRYIGLSAGSRSWRVPGGGVYTFSTYEPLQAMPPTDAAYFQQLPDFQVVT